MTKENVKSFFEQVGTDQTLQSKFQQLTNEHQQRIANKIIELARDNGFEFSLEDLKMFEEGLVAQMVENGELPENAMHAISGGANLDLRLTDLNLTNRSQK